MDNYEACTENSDCLSPYLLNGLSFYGICNAESEIIIWINGDKSHEGLAEICRQFEGGTGGGRNVRYSGKTN